MYDEIEPTLVILTPEYIDLFYEDCKQLNNEKKLKIKNILLLFYPKAQIKIKKD